MAFFKQNFGIPTATIRIGSIEVLLRDEGNGIRLTTDYENCFIAKQTLHETKEVLQKNLEIIKQHYLNKRGSTITEADMDHVCLKIAIYYFIMYNNWRSMYWKLKNKDLTFIQQDFEHPQTFNIIINYFTKKYPANYTEKCELMLNMTPEQLRDYVIRKEQFEHM